MNFTSLHRKLNYISCLFNLGVLCLYNSHCVTIKKAVKKSGMHEMKKLILVGIVLLIISASSCVITFQDMTSPPVETNTPSNTAPAVPIDPEWVPPKPQSNIQTLPSIADVVEKVYPSLVAINTETVTIDIFSRQQVQEGAGSGWIIDANGYIVTNNHVVQNAKKVTVELSDGRMFQANPENVYRDPVSDLAIININAKNLPAAELGDSSNLRVGEWVVAMGNPLGQGLRAKEGTISGLKVSLPVDQGQMLYDLIETSAAINPGNSGGPLVNMQGQVIGITSAKMAAVGVEGMGYAISCNTAIPIIEELINNGFVVRPWLGIYPVTNDSYYATIYRLSINTGVIVGSVDPNSPAQKAGLQELDIITHFKNKEVNSAEELVQAIHDSKVDEEVEITFIRGQSEKTTTTRLTKSPPP
jgi:serine protease Do